MSEFECGTCGAQSMRIEADLVHDGLWAVFCINSHRVWGHAGAVIAIEKRIDISPINKPPGSEWLPV